ncbi:GNAT family protein [Novosphingobium terrae]|uniref:N-acetyltransferase n=1 Tax=Novosphingobium terrae TaxID=2726189 RepID=UPI0019802785|nr:N-acetyltransferase [Novosphingobium terrae]
MAAITISPVTTKAERGQWVDYVYKANAGDPNFVPQLRGEELEKITAGGNPFHEHAKCQFLLAKRDGVIVGRIAALIDEQALGQPVEQGMGPGTGNWGALEAETQDIAHQLIAAAEDWLRAQGMTRVLAPMNLSVWEEPGLLVKGHDHPPTVMMGHQNAKFQPWIEAAGYIKAKNLQTYELDITKEFPPLIQRIVASGEKNPKINVRNVVLKDFAKEAAIILDILNDAWSDNWGFVPITDSEVAYTGKKLKPLIKADLVQIAEYEGEPVAFMMTLPDMNEVLAKIGPKPSPLGWIKLLLWIWRPRVKTMRVPLMGVRKKLQSSRLASQLAFMMIEYIRANSVANYGASRGEIGWILDDNQGMNSIAREIHSVVNKEYRIYEKAL